MPKHYAIRTYREHEVIAPHSDSWVLHGGKRSALCSLFLFQQSTGTDVRQTQVSEHRCEKKSLVQLFRIKPRSSSLQQVNLLKVIHKLVTTYFTLNEV